MREYGSLNGNTYFVGFLGKTKLVLLQDHNTEITGAEVARWTLHVEEAPLPDERRPTVNTPARAPQLALPVPPPVREAGRQASGRRDAVQTTRLLTT